MGLLGKYSRDPVGTDVPLGEETWPCVGPPPVPMAFIWHKATRLEGGPSWWVWLGWGLREAY